MVIKNKILEELTKNDGYVSGEALSELCAVSRTAIWKQIKNLQQAGYAIESQHGLGYRLTGRADVLNAREILQGLEAPMFVGEGKIHCFASVDSTNTQAKTMALAGYGQGTVVLAEMQTAGKGRLGRSWASQAGDGLWVSLILEPEVGIMEASRFSFVMAVAVAEALAAVVGIAPEIKWPNDVLLNGKKVCGILLEMVAEMARVDFLIVGIGINVNQQLATFPEEIRHKASSLALEKGEPLHRVAVLQAILTAVERNVSLYQREGFEAIKVKWLAATNMVGRAVRILDGEQRELYRGTALGIDDDGALLLQGGDGVQRVISGDVSLRSADGEYW